MAKKKANKPERQMTHRQLTRWQQQKRRQRITLISGALIVLAVLVVVTTGWFFSYFRPLHENIITVNGTEFNMSYYIKMLKYYGKGQSYPGLLYITDQVAEAIQINELVRQEAARSPINIVVSNEEIDKVLQERKLSGDYRDVIRAELTVKRVKDEYFDQQVPKSAPQRQAMVMLLESERQANEVRARLGQGEDFATLATELSLANISTKDGNLDWHPKNVMDAMLGSTIPGDYAFGTDYEILSQPRNDADIVKNAGYWLAQVSEKNADTGEVHLHAMLLGSKEQADSIRARVQAGEFFAPLAKEFSQLSNASENSGDLGTLDPSLLTPALQDFIKQTEINALSEPIRDDQVATKGGSWLIKVTGVDADREISAEHHDTLKEQATNEWLISLSLSPENNIVNNLDSARKSWAAEQAAKGMNNA